MAEFKRGNKNLIEIETMARNAIKNSNIKIVDSMEETENSLPFAFVEITSQTAEVVTRGFTNRQGNVYTSYVIIHLFFHGDELGTGVTVSNEIDNYLRSKMVENFDLRIITERDGVKHFLITIKGGF